jgi:hypothetical protein
MKILSLLSPFFVVVQVSEMYVSIGLTSVLYISVVYRKKGNNSDLACI